MSKLLGKLTNSIEPLFSHGIAKLEKATGCEGVDIRLIADIIEKSHEIMRKLGLDPSDTTGPELYASLIGYVRNNYTSGSLLDESDYLLVIIDDKIISFNLIDIIENIHHELDFKKSICSHGQRSLKGEIVSRYINHISTNEKVTLEIARSINLV